MYIQLKINSNDEHIIEYQEYDIPIDGPWSIRPTYKDLLQVWKNGIIIIPIENHILLDTILEICFKNHTKDMVSIASDAGFYMLLKHEGIDISSIINITENLEIEIPRGINITNKDDWDNAYELADKYAQRESQKDIEQNGPSVGDGYWFWFKWYLKQHYNINEK